MQADEIILKWYELAAGKDVDTDDVFFRFIAVWVAFNALYTMRFGHSNSFGGRVAGDRAQVNRFASDYSAKRRHTELMETDTEYRNAVLYLKSRGVFDTRTHERSYIEDEQSLRGVINCVYQVRCNLFHGDKIPDNTRDTEVVAASFTVVSKLIPLFLKSGFTTVHFLSCHQLSSNGNSFQGQADGVPLAASSPHIRATIVG